MTVREPDDPSARSERHDRLSTDPYQRRVGPRRGTFPAAGNTRGGGTGRYARLARDQRGHSLLAIHAYIEVADLALGIEFYCGGP